MLYFCIFFVLLLFFVSISFLAFVVVFVFFCVFFSAGVLVFLVASGCGKSESGKVLSKGFDPLELSQDHPDVDGKMFAFGST